MQTEYCLTCVVGGSHRTRDAAIETVLQFFPMKNDLGGYRGHDARAMHIFNRPKHRQIVVRDNEQGRACMAALGKKGRRVALAPRMDDEDTSIGRPVKMY